MASPANKLPADATAAVLQPSQPIPAHAISVQGPDFDTPLSLQDFLKSYERIGFQANSLGKAIDIVNHMVRLIDWNINTSVTNPVYTAQMASI
jgi:deoxyhypusine synthase